MSTVYALQARIRPFQTIGTAVGIDMETGELVTFGVDHRPLRALGQAIEAAGSSLAPPPLVEVESWQELGRDPAPSELLDDVRAAIASTN